MTADPPDKPPVPTFRTTLVRVMIVQVLTLVLLWILQAHYGR